MSQRRSTSLAGRQSATGVRARLRRTPGGGLLLRAVVFVVGLLSVLLGLALIALPGPLTIPPILLGVYVWSTEFAWADRLLERAKTSAREALEQARRRPVTSAVVTLGGVAALVIGIYLADRYALVARAQEALGLG